MTNCPNCGAPVESYRCSYCGAYIFDFAQTSDKEPFWISVNIGGEKRLLHVTLDTMEIRMDDGIGIYADWIYREPYFKFRDPVYQVDMSLRVVPDTRAERNILAIRKVEEG